MRITRLGWSTAPTCPPRIPGIPAQLQAAIDSLELVVVVDTMPSEITGYADVVLPECTYLERYDELRNAAERHGSLALRMPVFPPRYESKPGWWIAKQLGQRLGLDALFPLERLQRGARLAAQAGRVIALRDAAHRREELSAREPKYFADGPAGPLRHAERTDRALLATARRTWLRPDARVHRPKRPPKGYYHLNYGRMPSHTFGKTTNNPLLFQLAPENDAMGQSAGGGEVAAEQRPVRAPAQPGRQPSAIRFGSG